MKSALVEVYVLQQIDNSTTHDFFSMVGVRGCTWGELVLGALLTVHYIY
jgi:hypothetical protein